MRTRSLVTNFRDLAGLLALLTVLSLLTALSMSARAQDNPAPAPGTLPAPASPAARDSELYCAGYIEHAPNYSALEIVGGEQEQEQYIFARGDFVYIRGGARQAVRVGDEFTVIRPRGQFKSKLSKKDGWLGVYTQEIGRIRVTEVKDEVSVAVIAYSCDTVLLGDLLRHAPPRTSPPAQAEDVFDRFADPAGKPAGRIVAARDYREMVSREQVVYIDLGTEDNVRVGDRLTVYRPVGKGGLTRFREEEVGPTASYGFESEVFRGGQLSNKSGRVQYPPGDSIKGPLRTTAQVKDRRPPLPRKNVGEMVILNVQRRTATAIITRAVQEIHTGDYVEVR
ncbi:MAG TPA: hypothetical protein VIP46_04770 [Pyrinomonadaceae bacterium]